MKNKFEHNIVDKNDNLSFHCEICQDKGCQNCQGEYRQANDIISQEKLDEILLKDTQETDKNIIQEDDGLSFNCEYCQDSEGGCPQCGFGAKQARRNR